MALTLKLDSFDFSTYVRLQPGDGFDPTMNPVEPQFGESAAGEGNPLLGFSQPNRLMTWPVALTPAKSGGAYASTKTGLHQLIRDVNFTAQRASRVEWKDDGATSSTFFDVVAAKFEPEHNYWRGTHEWCLGVLKVWVKPYGDTGTLRITGTAAGTGVAVAATLGNVDGDVGAQVRAIVSVGSSPLRDGRLVGIAAVGASYAWDISLSQATWPQGSLYGASGAPGSQFLGRPLTGANLVAQGIPGDGWDEGFTNLARVFLSPASQYVGRNRILAVARHGGIDGFEVRLKRNDGAGADVVGGGLATAIPGAGWGTVDFGVLAVPSAYPAATIELQLQGRYNAQPLATPAVSRPLVHGYFATTGQQATFEPAGLARFLVLPEESLTLVRDTERRLLGGDGAVHDNPNETGGVGSYMPLASRADAIGNPWELTTIIGTGLVTHGVSIRSQSFGTGISYGANQIGATGADLRVDSFVTGLAGGGFPDALPSRSVYVGKTLATGFYAARLHVPTSGLYAFSLVYGQGSLAAASVLASQGISFASAGPQATAGDHGYLTFRNRGAQLTGELTMMAQGSTVRLQLSAVASGASGFGNNPAQPGKGFVGQWYVSPYPSGAISGAFNVLGLRVSDVPSSAAPADKYVFDGATGDDAAYMLNSASAFRRGLEAKRGGMIPRAAPSAHAKLVAVALPLDNDPGNDLIALEVRVRERFKYGAA